MEGGRQKSLILLHPSNVSNLSNLKSRSVEEQLNPLRLPAASLAHTHIRV